jgi:hypothetical protein
MLNPKLIFPVGASSTYTHQHIIPHHPIFPIFSQTHIVNLHLLQRARPPVKPKHIIRQRNRLSALKIRNLVASGALPMRNVFRAELLIEAGLERRDFLRSEIAHGLFVEGVLDVG